jgi:hypothetical protein
MENVVAPILVYRLIDYWVVGAVGIVAASRTARTGRDERNRSTL